MVGHRRFLAQWAFPGNGRTWVGPPFCFHQFVSCSPPGRPCGPVGWFGARAFAPSFLHALLALIRLCCGWCFRPHAGFPLVGRCILWLVARFPQLVPLEVVPQAFSHRGGLAVLAGWIACGCEHSGLVEASFNYVAFHRVRLKKRIGVVMMATAEGVTLFVVSGVCF